MHFSHKHQVMLTITIIAVLFSIILFMLGPTIRGYNITKEFEKYGGNVNDVFNSLEKMNNEKEILNIKLNSCQTLNRDYEDQIKLRTNETFSLMQEINQKEREIEILKIQHQSNISDLNRNFENDLSSYKEENQRLNERLNTIEDDLNLIIHNAANNICCKYRVDYPQTDSYFISNNRIICSVGEENKINCS